MKLVTVVLLVLWTILNYYLVLSPTVYTHNQGGMLAFMALLTGGPILVLFIKYFIAGD